MIKKISLYGLCFNICVAFGWPTQKQLEDFLTKQGDKVKVLRATIGELTFPDEIVFEDKNVQETLETYCKRYETGALDEYSEYRSMPKKLTPKECNACFLKYSRTATEAERSLVAGWGVDHLRIVDFNSIVDGCDNEEQKREARLLKQKENDEKLFATIDKWVDERKINSGYTLRAINPETKEAFGWFPYKLCPEIIKSFKERLKSILKNMSCYERTREILVLSLVFSKCLQFEIGTKGCWHCDGCIEFQFENHEAMDTQALCHELNHALHYSLGIKAHNFLLTGDFDSQLEQDLFRFSDQAYSDAETIKVPSPIYCMHGGYSRDMPKFIKIQSLFFFRKFQTSSLWDGFEELWNIIGFAKVNYTIYVNRMSDMNYMKIPVLFHDSLKNFTDEFSYKYGYLDADPIYESFLDFFEQLDEMIENNISDLCPTPEAWNTWLQLQNRGDAGDSYLTTLDKPLEVLIDFIKKNLSFVGRIKT